MAPELHRPVLEVRQVGAVSVARILSADLLDDKTINAIGDQLTELVAGGCQRLVLNLAKVKRLSSSMIGKIIGLHKQLHAGGGRLVVCEIVPPASGVFEALHLHQLFSVCDEERHALQSFV